MKVEQSKVISRCLHNGKVLELKQLSKDWLPHKYQLNIYQDGTNYGVAGKMICTGMYNYLDYHSAMQSLKQSKANNKTKTRSK